MTARGWSVARVGRYQLDVIALAILVGALALRLYLAGTLPYIHDEENNAIPLARSISFTPGAVNLPLRGENHGALPAYVVKASGVLFGEGPLGVRALHIALGVLTVLLVYATGREWYGAVAGRWAAALVAFNDYFLPISSRATAHAPFLCLMALAIWAFSRFLRDQRPQWLSVSAIAIGLAFYCKEHAVLLLPVFFLTLLHPRLRAWLTRASVWGAVGLVALLLAPDVYRNAVAPEETLVSYGDRPALQATYGNHLRRVGGIGFSPYPFVFYGRSAVMPLYRVVMGADLYDETAEYASINPLLGLLMLGAAVAALVPRGTRVLGTHFFALAFWCIFGLFVVIAKGDPPGRLSPISWMWVEASMFPAALLLGQVLDGHGARTRALGLVAVVALALSVASSLGLVSI